MKAKIDIYKSGAILIRNRKLLVERTDNKDYFIAPGGTVEPGESSTETLVRELLEEFKVIVAEDGCELFGIFTAHAAGREDKIVEMTVFLVNDWVGEPVPDNEVEEIRWIDSTDLGNIKLGSIFEHEVIPKLKASGLIN